MTAKPLPSSRANVHPSDHAASLLTSQNFDVICLGSGWACRIAAAALVKDGCSVLIIEEELVGGDCPFWACVPSKVLLNPAEALPVAASTGGAKASPLPGKTYDAEATFARRDVFTGNYKDSALLVPMVEGAGVVIARGVGSLSGKKRVNIVPAAGDAVEVQAKLAVILGLGSVPAIPNIPGLKESNPWMPRDATSAQKVPEHLIVIGAGAVGTEMATAYAALGGKVSLISRSKEILPAVDVEAGRVVREALQARGVDVKLGAEVVEVQRESVDRVSVILSTGEQIQGSEILLAAGRKGVHDRVGLQTVGAKANASFIPVAEDLSVQITCPNTTAGSSPTPSKPGSAARLLGATRMHRTMPAQTAMPRRR